MITKTFFDSISFSAVERIHSAVLAWIFSLGNKFIGDKEKSDLIKKLLNIEEKIEFSNFRAYAEVNTIDLLIECDTALFAIENKLKSSEHSDQTNKMPEKLIEIASGRNCFYGFLTLIKEQAKNENVSPINYEFLYKSLTDLGIVKSENDKNKNVTRDIILEYLSTLKNLNRALNEFINNHKTFPKVFIDGGLTKIKKYKKYSGSNIDTNNLEIIEYIQQNQLETIFQKAFWLNIGLKLALMSGETFKTDESHGTGLIQVYLKECKYLAHTYQISIQWQGKTLKINLADKDYKNSNSMQITETIIGRFQESFANKDGFGNINPPKKSGGKAYISVTRSMGKEIYEYDQKELIEELNFSIRNLRNKLKTFNLD